MAHGSEPPIPHDLTQPAIPRERECRALSGQPPATEKEAPAEEEKDVNQDVQEDEETT